jgi:metallophosphoesterase superfamily enzyme
MNLEFIEQGPALLVSNEKTVLVLADLHFGIESGLASQGIHFKSRSRQRQEKAIRCIKDTSPDIIMLLGDVKHSIPLTTRQEYLELPEMLTSFRKLGHLMVTPGNHDVGIERFLKPGELLPKEGRVIDGTGYLHGHTYPGPSLSGHLIIAGHHHPFVSLRDEVGCSLRSPAYLFAALSEECFTRDARLRSSDRVISVSAPGDAGGKSGGVYPGKQRAGRKKPLVNGVRKQNNAGYLHNECQAGYPEVPAATGERPLQEAGEAARTASRVLFIPAFNELSGFDILKIADSPISPLSRFMKKDSCEIYLPDGTYIGPLSSVEDYGTC